MRTRWFGLIVAATVLGFVSLVSVPCASAQEPSSSQPSAQSSQTTTTENQAVAPTTEPKSIGGQLAEET